MSQLDVLLGSLSLEFAAINEWVASFTTMGDELVTTLLGVTTKLDTADLVVQDEVCVRACVRVILCACECGRRQGRVWGRARVCLCVEGKGRKTQRAS